MSSRGFCSTMINHNLGIPMGTPNLGNPHVAHGVISWVSKKTKAVANINGHQPGFQSTRSCGVLCGLCRHPGIGPSFSCHCQHKKGSLVWGKSIYRYLQWVVVTIHFTPQFNLVTKFDFYLTFPFWGCCNVSHPIWWNQSKVCLEMRDHSTGFSGNRVLQNPVVNTGWVPKLSKFVEKGPITGVSGE